jgi:hypothetical protein
LETLVSGLDDPDVLSPVLQKELRLPARGVPLQECLVGSAPGDDDHARDRAGHL